MDTYTHPVPPKRRYLELEQKQRIVEETLAEGASVAQIARLHGVTANLVFNWRRLYRAGQLGGRERLHFHQQHSRPVMDALQQWLDAQLKENKVEPDSGLGKAHQLHA